MPTIDQHQSADVTKMLVLADSGGGKSGALISLAAAGYNLRIIDTDNGLDVLRHYATSPKSSYFQKDPSIASRIEFVTLTEAMKNVGGKLVPKTAKVWSDMVNLLQHWKEVDPTTKTVLKDLGPVQNWTSKEILVIDTLSSVSTAAMNQILALNTRLGQQPQQQDWLQAQMLVEGLLQALFDSAFPCNVIVNCHITYIEDSAGGASRGYPFTLGKALPPRVGRYFNSALMLRSVGTKRQFHTDTIGLVELKTTAPLNVPKVLPIEDGLALYFAAVRGGAK